MENKLEQISRQEDASDLSLCAADPLETCFLKLRFVFFKLEYD